MAVAGNSAAQKILPKIAAPLRRCGFGLGVINYLLDLVWDWYADPQGELTREIGAQLDRLRTMIIEGDGSTRGLRGELEACTRRRAKMRARALAELLDPAK